MDWTVFRDLAAGAGAIILLGLTLALGVWIDRKYTR